MASAGARLQHLQVVIEGPGYQMWPPLDPKLDQLWEGGFWSAVKAFPDLAALQLFLQPNCFDGPTPGKQVLSNKDIHCPAELNALGAWLPQGVLSVAEISCTDHALKGQGGNRRSANSLRQPSRMGSCACPS